MWSAPVAGGTAAQPMTVGQERGGTVEWVLRTNLGSGAVLWAGRLLTCSDTGLFVLSNYRVSFLFCLITLYFIIIS